MEKPGWVLALEARYGVPIEDVPGTVYILHYDPPQVVRSVSRDYSGQLAEPGPHGLESDGPISHYVGWSQQPNPRRRIYKLTGTCPKCGTALRDSLSAEYLEHLDRAKPGA
jgi:hypothetical protein